MNIARFIQNLPNPTNLTVTAPKKAGKVKWRNAMQLLLGLFARFGLGQGNDKAETSA
jgi:hypothetical protein